MSKLKRTSILTINFLLIVLVFFKINTFGFEKNLYSYKEKTTINQDNQDIKVKKGFTFTLKFKNPQNIDFSINLTDIVIKHLKKILKENFDDDKYINKIFKNYKVNYNKKNSTITLYVYPPADEYRKIKKFVINKLSDKDFKDLFSELKIQEEEYKDFMNEYKDLLVKKYETFIRKIIKNYRNDDYSKMYNIFYDILSNVASTSNIVSSMSQHKKVKKLSEDIEKKLKIIYNKNLKSKSKYNYFDDYYYDDYEDFKKSSKFLDYFDDYDEDEEDEEDENENNINDNDKIFNTLEKNIMSFVKIYENNIKNLDELNYSDFKDILNSVSFGDRIKPIEKKVIKFNGIVEKITKK